MSFVLWFVLFGYGGVLLYKYFFKKLSPSNFIKLFKRRQKLQKNFFMATFMVMGRLAKVDGIINKREIKAATQWMADLKMDAEQVYQAQGYFNQGKDPATDIEPPLLYLRKHSTKSLIKFFLEIQLSFAYADAGEDIRISEMNFLREICGYLKVNARIFDYIYKYFKLQRNFHREYTRYKSEYNSKIDPLKQSYQLLGVKPRSSDAEVKKSYRKLMSEHHPDKIVSKGLPESMNVLAKEKAQEIQAAYDTIKKHRKNR